MMRLNSTEEHELSPTFFFFALPCILHLYLYFRLNRGNGNDESSNDDHVYNYEFWKYWSALCINKVWIYLSYPFLIITSKWFMTNSIGIGITNLVFLNSRQTKPHHFHNLINSFM